MEDNESTFVIQQTRKVHLRLQLVSVAVMEGTLCKSHDRIDNIG